MKRTLFVLVFSAGAMLALSPAAIAKGPSKASVEGPELKGTILLVGSGEEPGSPLGDLTQEAGFFPAVFGQTPDPMLPGRPSGELGPKYTITYTVPGPSSEDEILQDLYPYAKDGPVTFMPAGQRLFDTEQTRGGWYRAGPALKRSLVAAGLPASAPTSADGDSASFVDAWAWILAGLGGALVLAAACALLVRRLRPAAA